MLPHLQPKAGLPMVPQGMVRSSTMRAMPAKSSPSSKAVLFSSDTKRTAPPAINLSPGSKAFLFSSDTKRAAPKSTLKRSATFAASGGPAAAAAPPAAPARGQMKRASSLATFVLDPAPDAPPIAEQIKDCLMSSYGSVLDVFRSWDADSDFLVSRAEFGRAMDELGLVAPPEHLDKLFTAWDPDRSGAITLAELAAKLREPPLLVKIRDALANKGYRVSDFFRECDADLSGEISLDEFVTGLKNKAGIVLDATQQAQIWRTVNADGDSTLSFKELKKLMRRDVQAERDRVRRAALERTLNLYMPPEVVDVVDVAEARAIARVRVRTSVDSPYDVAHLDDGGADREHEHHAATREAAAASKSDHDRLRMDRLRLRGTGLEEAVGGEQGEDEGDGGVAPTGKGSASKSPPRAVTRHSRLPELSPSASGAALPLVSVLAAHRRRSHAPAHRHVRVLVPPAPPKLSNKRLSELRVSKSESILPPLPSHTRRPTRHSHEDDEEFLDAVTRHELLLSMRSMAAELGGKSLVGHVGEDDVADITGVDDLDPHEHVDGESPPRATRRRTTTKSAAATRTRRARARPQPADAVLRLAMVLVEETRHA